MALAALGGACHGAAPASTPAGAREQRPPAGQAVVVSHQDAQQLGRPTPLQIVFARGHDGTQLVAEFLAKADQLRAERVADLAIVIASRRGELLVECRSEVVPESVAAPQWQPPVDRVVSLDSPITRSVTEWVYQCRPFEATQQRSRIEYDKQCGNVVRAVPRSTTTYVASNIGVSSTSPTRSVVPMTDFYTEYQNAYECESVPVARVGPEVVTQTKCSPELETRTVTRHAFQLEQEYVPCHFEAFARQRLRELAPVCYTLDPRGPAPRNRIEGMLFSRAPGPETRDDRFHPPRLGFADRGNSDTRGNH